VEKGVRSHFDSLAPRPRTLARSHIHPPRLAFSKFLTVAPPRPSTHPARNSFCCSGSHSLTRARYSPLLRAQARLPHSEVTYALGCGVTDPSTAGFADATAAAAAADTVVMFLGIDGTVENEGRDRDSLELPGVQAQLAAAVAAAAKAPVVVVLVNGGPLAVAELKSSDKVGE
jgi:hypothetical protein